MKQDDLQQSPACRQPPSRHTVAVQPSFRGLAGTQPRACQGRRNLLI